jgi:hypothetical protein
MITKLKISANSAVFYGEFFSPFQIFFQRRQFMNPNQTDKSSMELLREEKIANRMAEIPKKYRRIYKKAVESRSKSAAVKVFCLECVCWQKNEIINCSCLTCPLYGVRPFIKSRQASKNDGFSGQTSTCGSTDIAKQGAAKITGCFAH